VAVEKDPGGHGRQSASDEFVAPVPRHQHSQHFLFSLVFTCVRGLSEVACLKSRPIVTVLLVWPWADSKKWRLKGKKMVYARECEMCEPLSLAWARLIPIDCTVSPHRPCHTIRGGMPTRCTPRPLPREDEEGRDRSLRHVFCNHVQLSSRAELKIISLG
jgi:hypothetical protein